LDVSPARGCPRADASTGSGVRRQDPALTAGRGLAVAVLLVLAAAGAALAQSDAEREAAAMRQTVLDQLEAFRRGDWAAAYGYASESIQKQFTPEAFREMVTRGYAPIAASSRATVRRTLLDVPGHGFVKVRVYGQDGETIDALYELVEEKGAWRINGVVAKPAPAGELTRADHTEVR
jgi:Domain of unknown function (DUF4864)